MLGLLPVCTPKTDCQANPSCVEAWVKLMRAKVHEAAIADAVAEVMKMAGNSISKSAQQIARRTLSGLGLPFWVGLS